MSDIFGGKTESKVRIPQYLEDAYKQNLNRGRDVAQIGYMPYMGPEVAAFTPSQQAAMQNTMDASSAFGLSAPRDAMAGVPQAQTFAGGLQGYSSYPTFQESLDKLRQTRPGQMALYDSLFVDPVTGQRPGGSYGAGGVPGGNVTGGGQGTAGEIMNNPTAPIGGSNQPDPIYDAGYGATGAGYMPTQSTMPYADSPISGVDPQVFQPMPQVNTNPVTVESISSGVNPDYGYQMQEQDPSFIDRLAQGAGTLGRGIIDNTLIGRGYNFLSDDKLSNTLLGQQTPLYSGSTLAPSPGTRNVLDDGTMDFDRINQFLEDTNQFQAAPEVKVTNIPAVTAPESFFTSGNMFNPNPAGMSPVKSLFDAFDVNNRDKPKNSTRPIRQTRSIR